MSKDTAWNPSIYKCMDCGDEIYSQYPGDFATCRCYLAETNTNIFGCFVDQTEHYIRIGGNAIFTGRKLKNDS